MPLVKSPWVTANVSGPAFLLASSTASPRNVPPPSQMSSTMTHGAPARSSASTSNPESRPVAVSRCFSACGAESVDAAWVDVASLDRTLLAFDHAAILSAGIERARNRIEYTTLAPTFCGDTFSMGELRSVYETLWGHPLDPANFNRKVLATPGFVEPTGDVVAQPKGRPAKTYQRGQAKRLDPPLQR